MCLDHIIYFYKILKATDRKMEPYRPIYYFIIIDVDQRIYLHVVCLGAPNNENSGKTHIEDVVNG